MKLLSVIVPCFNEEEVLLLFYNEICKEADKFESIGVSFEILFIDDGSKDRTLELAKNLREKDSRVRYISFSRNFGKESAIFAGLEKSMGDYVVMIDADLQDPPSFLMEMYKAVAEDGYDSAATRRTTRKGEPAIRSFFARQYYKLIRKISKTEFVDGARDFRLMTRQMVDAILEMREYNRFTKGINEWVGFKTKWLEYENVQRVAGNTKWSFWQLFLYSMEGITAFSTVPLALAALLGMFLCLMSFFFICVIVIRTLAFGDPVSGWPSLAVIILFIGGIQLFCIGILGQYMAKTYLETKKRPIYIIKESEIVLERLVKYPDSPSRSVSEESS
ncbi:MAG: glycosyltransferase family 2 protein [Candidatus Riflebacteria bacterium]|nr:glycosyltransferase family 2 protein [Candidatus Riflebacteria bacterium]